MVTIIGNGMGKYDFSNLNIDITKYDKILCDVNFKEEQNNILKLKFKEIKEYIVSNYEKENILYVVTGSPLFFSAGIIIANALPKEKVKIINNTSSKDYMMEKLFISEANIDTVSLHGREHFDLSRFLTNSYTFVLCDKDSIEKITQAVKFLNKEDITVSIGYKLGYEDEIIKQIDIFSKECESFDLSKPYVLIIKRNFALKNQVSEDAEFDTQRGMITKKYKRHLSLQNLDLKPNLLLWDIGAGSGSCGIEAYTRYKTRTLFFEKNEERIENIKTNLTNHKVIACELFVGEAQDKFESLEENPQRIFVGGGGEEVIKRLPYLYERLEEAGIMLINAITLKHLSLMNTVLNEVNIDYEIHSISLTTYKGKLDLVEPERQLFQIKIIKEESK
ncbi:precorrin-6Y C5,15-methyltransferase (decarboxylating) subunit CbiT [Arcobacter sp. F2176]|uniref:precorrin-6Y C5,15-methyltransferase (decarboxylating) subunit CbiT n=1 Tax=Arcobacter sp. F2176 TaxID=2044511 RepID=UPI00100A6684|nr:precorrin-6Y C5,15-methyltransferase (decarboxylating) subunit CbiT [Arcobacter sp. F2176]RXJ81144.1 precorrin-6Y C5,15-methyltransferase (decarboxylating) subunit CbiT [Arcobacter sp. F2176]